MSNRRALRNEERVIMREITRRVGTGFGIAALMSMFVLVPATAVDGNPVTSTVDYSYHCDSAAGHSETAYTMVATAPDTVVQGQTFEVTGFVVTGAPPEDLLISHITFAIDPPANATTESPLFFGFDGPGSTNPPGPIAKKGVPYSSPAMSFTMQATGPVGSTIDIYPGNVSSTVVNPADLSQTLDVTCARDFPVLLTRTTIVAPADTATTSTTSTTSSSSTSSTSTTSTTSASTSSTSTTEAVSPSSVTASPPTTSGGSVLGESIAAAPAVAASPAFTG
jgi:hypothetical protein